MDCRCPSASTGESEALLVDAAFTRADGHRLAAAVLDSGKTPTTVFVSGAEVVADAFPDARFVATPLGANLPTRLVDVEPLTGGLTLESHRFELKGGSAELPDRHHLWRAERRATAADALVARSPDHGMLIAARIGAKAAKGEMTWG